MFLKVEHKVFVIECRETKADEKSAKKRNQMCNATKFPSLKERLSTITSPVCVSKVWVHNTFWEHNNYYMFGTQRHCWFTFSKVI